MLAHSCVEFFSLVFALFHLNTFFRLFLSIFFLTCNAACVFLPLALWMYAIILHELKYVYMQQHFSEMPTLLNISQCVWSGGRCRGILRTKAQAASLGVTSIYIFSLSRLSPYRV